MRGAGITVVRCCGDDESLAVMFNSKKSKNCRFAMSMRHLSGRGNMIRRYVSLQSRSLTLELELKGSFTTSSSVDKPFEQLVKIETAYLPDYFRKTYVIF